MFYTFDNTPGAPLRVTRNFACVACHTSEATVDVPGMFIGNVFSAADGTPLYGPAYMTDHRTPFAVRWGGWFVTDIIRLSATWGTPSSPKARSLATS